MKFIASLTCLLLITFAAPGFALQGGDCAARSQKLKQNERAAFMKSCLAQAQEPANVREEERKQKTARCEQNAKNKKLQGREQADYHADCMNKNEAADKANAQSAGASAPKAGASSTRKHESRKAAKHQSTRAKKSAKKQPVKPSEENKAQ